MDKCSTYEGSLETQIGLLKIYCCTKGVHSIHICEKENISSPTLNNVSETVNGPRCLTETLEWLQCYFEGHVTAKPPDVCVLVMRSKGPFAQLAWLALQQDVPAGRTVSYGELAVMCGSIKGAARALGTAMRTNPVPLLVPCHRVVKGGGVLGRYSGGGGARIKEWLLRHEGVEIFTQGAKIFVRGASSRCGCSDTKLAVGSSG